MSIDLQDFKAFLQSSDYKNLPLKISSEDENRGNGWYNAVENIAKYGRQCSVWEIATASEIVLETYKDYGPLSLEMAWTIETDRDGRYVSSRLNVNGENYDRDYSELPEDLMAFASEKDDCEALKTLLSAVEDAIGSDFSDLDRVVERPFREAITSIEEARAAKANLSPALLGVLESFIQSQELSQATPEAQATRPSPRM